MFILLYKLMERIDGEKGKMRLLPYNMAEKIKIWCLLRIF